MSAPELTDEAVGIITEEDPDLMVLNYANPDMVGHTGDFDAAVEVEAVEAVDAQLHPPRRGRRRGRPRGRDGRPRQR